MEYSDRAEISVRGNTSFYFTKKPYRLELQNEDGEDKKVSLLGMPAESDWILYPSFTDKTFARNVLAHELWRRMGYYAVRWRFVEVFVVTNEPPRMHTNGHESLDALGSAGAPVVEGAARPQPGSLPKERVKLEAPLMRGVELQDWLNRWHATQSVAAAVSWPSVYHPLTALFPDSYQGVYVLLEKPKRGKHRVNVKRLKPEDDAEPEITGGYIIKQDRLDPNERGTMTGQEFRVTYVDPKEEELTPAQKQWMAKYLDDFEKALFGLNFRDPVNGYAKYIDADSFIDYHWMVEVGKNADGYAVSQYMHKDRGGKLKMGPLWDWDSTFGNSFIKNGYRTNGWRFEYMPDPDYTWYRRLFEDPDFLQRYVDRWSELRTNVFATSNMLALVDSIVGQLKEAEARNFQRWPILGSVVPDGPIGDTYQDEVHWLKQWITGRLAWIDSQDFPKPEAERFVENSEIKLRLSTKTGRIFYTVDGADPRRPGGSMSSTALEYRGPIILARNVQVFARVRSDFNLWSAPVVIDPPSRNEPRPANFH